MTPDVIMLKMDNISKQFSNVTVLDKVSFNLKKGEVHVLIGENGAGKSTLMKILNGIYKCDGGEIFLRNNIEKMERIEFSNPREALETGISMVFQEFNLMNNMTIAENIFIGHEPVKNNILDRKKLYFDTKEQLKKVSLDVSPTTIVENLTTAQKQCVEIAKCLSHSAKIIVFDEPTSSLSEKEVSTLFDLINNLKRKGVSIVYISHRMQEVFQIGDRITVFRDGKVIDTVNANETNENELVKMIIGREFSPDIYNNNSKNKNIVMLEGKNITLGKFNKKIDFNVYKGEILGIFGLIGAGRTELARGIFGIDPIGEGVLNKNGVPIFVKNPKGAINHKIGLVPEDRKELGLHTMLSVRENLTLIKLRELPKVLFSKMDETKVAEEFIKKLSVVTMGPDQIVDRLSGGNQQKIAIAKWLALDLDILILDEPTRGVDVGAKAEIYDIIHQLAHAGKSIIMISSDLPEILRVSHRVIVMHDGEIKLEEHVSNLDQEIIMHAAIR
jgi:ribose transport system ATP-binding protein